MSIAICIRTLTVIIRYVSSNGCWCYIFHRIHLFICGGGKDRDEIKMLTVPASSSEKILIMFWHRFVSMSVKLDIVKYEKGIRQINAKVIMLFYLLITMWSLYNIVLNLVLNYNNLLNTFFISKKHLANYTLYELKLCR